MGALVFVSSEDAQFSIEDVELMGSATSQFAVALDVQAYETYLKARNCLAAFTRESLPQSKDLFEQVIALDAGFALAQSGLAMAAPPTRSFFARIAGGLPLPAGSECRSQCRTNGAAMSPHRFHCRIRHKRG